MNNKKRKPQVVIEGLSKAFGDNRVLNGIDLEIFQGEIIAIVGGSGCEKTVLVNHMLGQTKRPEFFINRCTAKKHLADTCQ